MSSFKFIDVHMWEDVSWTANTTALVKKDVFLKLLKKVNLNKHLLATFYHCKIESTLRYGISK